MKEQILDFCQLFYAVFSMIVYGNLWLNPGNFLFRVLFTLMFAYSAYLLVLSSKKIWQKIQNKK
ncbi:hypothetical protein [Lactobacillus sp.]|uniref:hypothetical protein n=1 Tax=Lactobacillus sp. TaxID=1591 RepID=UPI003EFD6AFD